MSDLLRKTVISLLYPLCGSKISEELKNELVRHGTVDRESGAIKSMT